MDYQRSLLLRYFKFFIGLSIFFDILPAQRGYRAFGQYCTKHESYITSTLVPYVETYVGRNWLGFRKILTRNNYRWESNSHLRTVRVCCHGYEPSGLNCVPVCPSGCENGQCYQPNVCTCLDGYHLIVNAHRAWMECVPHCPDGCDGGVCTAPGTCTCNVGYRFSEESKSCEASCLSVGAGGSNGCGENASCIAPDTCRCRDGYAKNPEGSQPLCRPICSPGCGTNAFCDSPGRCICDPGYFIDGYELLKITRPPFFTPVGTTPNFSRCKPSCAPECPTNSTCVAPDKCQCDPGYGSTSSYADSVLKCDPICERTCVNAFCGYPNECVCHLGHQPHPVEDFVCEPVCRDGCVNARCVQPDRCECNDGYVKMDDDDGHHESNSTNICVPRCPGGCPNGKCVAPGQCACDPGYVLSSQETTADFSTTTEFSSTSSEPNGYYMTDTTDYFSTDSTDYITDNTDYYSTHSANYYDTSSTIAPVSRQICQPLCEPECPTGSICIAPPDHCESRSGISEDSDDVVTDRRIMKTDTNVCDRNGTGNGTCICNGSSSITVGSSCDAMESAIISHTAASAIGTLVLLAAIFGLGAVVYWTLRKRKKVATQAFETHSVGAMETMSASDPLISTDISTNL